MMKTLVVAPMTREARSVGGRAVTVGAGARSGERLRAILSETPPEAVVIAGICGALDPSLKPGDIILSRCVVADSLPDLLCEPRLLNVAEQALSAPSHPHKRRQARPIMFVSASLLSVDYPSMDFDQRLEHWNALGAAGVDMETYALANAAMDAGLPWLAIRAVSDGARARMPVPIATWRGEDDDMRVALAIARRPWEWLSAARLAWDTGTALRSLAAAAALVVRELDGIG